MGLKDLFKRAPAAPEMVQLARRSFLFNDADSAQQFQASIQSARTQFGDLVSYMRSHAYASQYNGVLFRSTLAREAITYGYAPVIYRNDREYLLERDPTAGMLIEDPAKMLWNGIPYTYVPEIDSYFAEQIMLGLLASFQASYQEFYQEGGALIYLEATGDPMERIQRGDRPLRWTFIPAANVIDTSSGEFGFILAEGAAAADALLDHGIEYISFYPTDVDRLQNRPIKVHGSRIIPINLDPRKQKWWRTNHVPFHKIYDTLWELRDLIFARVRANFQGDPIVVDVDLSADAQKALNFQEMDETQKEALGKSVEKAIIDNNTGVKSSYAPVMGFKMRRLGAAQLSDASQDFAILGARLSHGSVFSVKQVIASTKGNSDAGDQDIIHLASKIGDTRDTWGYGHLKRALLLGRVMGAAGLRMQDTHDLPPPCEIVWNPIRRLTPREASFTEKTDVSMARQLQEAALELPPRLKRKFPEDARFPIPLWLAARGRDTLGRNTDVDPKIEPGASNPSPDGSAPSSTKPKKAAPSASDVADELRPALEAAIEEALDARMPEAL